MTHAANVWNKFCQRFWVLKQSVPLFTTDADGVVANLQPPVALRAVSAGHGQHQGQP